MALDEIGYDTVDLGALAQGWRIQRDTAAYGCDVRRRPSPTGPRAPSRPTAMPWRRPPCGRSRYRDA